MCAGIALAAGELPREMAQRHGLGHRLHERGGDLEFRFLCDDPTPKLPIRRDGQLQLVRWGNRKGRSRWLPRTCWTWASTIEQGGWSGRASAIVEIPATLGWERGIWFRVRQGIQGLLVPDERGCAVVYMICEPSTHYYRVMTRSDRMPSLIGERI